jgi:hypothetical protein
MGRVLQITHAKARTNERLGLDNRSRGRAPCLCSPHGSVGYRQNARCYISRLHIKFTQYSSFVQQLLSLSRIHIFKTQYQSQIGKNTMPEM